jgi:hypothetical protein
VASDHVTDNVEAPMRMILYLAMVALVLSAIEITTSGPADARISCSSYHGCVEGKYVRRPIAGLFCRSVIRKRPGYRTHFFCTVA